MSFENENKDTILLSAEQDQTFFQKSLRGPAKFIRFVSYITAYMGNCVVLLQCIYSGLLLPFCEFYQ